MFAMVSVLPFGCQKVTNPEGDNASGNAVADISNQQAAEYHAAASDNIAELSEAKKLFLEGKKLYATGHGYNRVDFEGVVTNSEAQQLLESSMKRWLEAMEKYPEYFDEKSSYVHDAMLTIRYWKQVLRNNGTEEPIDFPLKPLWESHSVDHSKIEDQFLRETGPRSQDAAAAPTN